MKFYVVVNYNLVGLYFLFHEDLRINACERVVNAQAHVLLRLRAFTTHVCAFKHKFEAYAHTIEIDHHIKFHEDLSFRCGDIYKTIMVFFNDLFSMYF